jgi:hypothetical protein
MGQMIPDTAFEIVKRYADKALQIDDGIAEGISQRERLFILRLEMEGGI